MLYPGGLFISWMFSRPPTHVWVFFPFPHVRIFAAGDQHQGDGGSVNVQGEEQKKLDVISNDVLKNALRSSGESSCVNNNWGT